MTVLTSCFAQLVHKSQTIFQTNAKLEVCCINFIWLYFVEIYFNYTKAQLIDMRTEIIDIKADQQALEQQLKTLTAQLHASQLECQILKNESGKQEPEIDLENLTFDPVI